MANDFDYDSTDDEDDDGVRFRYTGYTVICIPTKGPEEFNSIYEYIMNTDGDLWSVIWETYKTLMVMFSPSEIKEVKEYLSERGIEYRIHIEDVQMFLEENERRRNSNVTRRLRSLRIRG